jgi:hypothetical protein
VGSDISWVIIARECVRRVVNLSGQFVGCCDTRGLTYPLFHLFVLALSLGRDLLTDLDLSVHTGPAVYDGACVRSVFQGFAPDNDTAPLPRTVVNLLTRMSVFMTIILQLVGRVCVIGTHRTLNLNWSHFCSPVKASWGL